MARKRYETAFIPASNSPSQYPDVDSLLLSVDSFSILDREELERRSGRTESREFFPHHRWRSKSVNQERFLLDRREAAISSLSPETYQMGPSGTEVEETREQGSRISKSILETIASGHSRSVSPVRKMPISLSEPLHPRRHFQIMKSYASIQSSSGCSTNNSSSPVSSEGLGTSSRTGRRTTQNATHVTKGPKVLTLMKLNSNSSIDSIDSDEFKYLEKGSAPRPPPACNLLSPISDKSPLESMDLLGKNSGSVKEVNKEREIHQLEGSHECIGIRKQNIQRTPEHLANLPWEMPKLKRKLALLVDSGISLDSHGSRDPEPTPWILGDGRPRSVRTYPNHGHGLGKDKSSRRLRFDEVHQSAHRKADVTSLVEFSKDLNVGCDDVPSSFGVPPPPPEVLPTLSLKPDRFKMKLDFGASNRNFRNAELINPGLNLDVQGWFHGAITRIEAEDILRVTKEGSFLVRNCESSVYNRYSLSLKSSRGFIHVRIEPNLASGKYFLGGSPTEEFQSVPSLVLHFMSHRLPMKGAEHVILKFPVITNFL